MKRILTLSFIALMVLTTAAGAQLMGNGHYWFSGDGGIPRFTPADVFDGNIDDMKANGYYLSWGPSDVYRWGDLYGFSSDIDMSGTRYVVRAYDIDNNLYCSEFEDPADCGTDADLYLHYWFSWDDEAMYVAGDVIDDVYDIIAGPDDPDWAFWKRDHFWMSIDVTGTGAFGEGAYTPHFHAHPMPIDEAVYSMQIHWGGELPEVMYGDDPDFFMGSTTDGGPSDTGYWFMTKITWDLLFLYAPELRDNVGPGYQFRMRFIIPDADGDDGYGQMFWGVSYDTFGEGVGYWPLWYLTEEMATAVESSSWGHIKKLH